MPLQKFQPIAGCKMTKRSWSSKIDEIASNIAEATEEAPEKIKASLEDASKELAHIAALAARRERARKLVPAIAELPFNATASEVGLARSRQAVRKGEEIFLPSWDSGSRGMPSILLRTSLFSCSSHVQKKFDAKEIDLKNPPLKNKEIATFKNVSVYLTGYELCQFDRHVYATCINYYRNSPLSEKNATSSSKERSFEVSFYKFTEAMGRKYGQKSCKAIRDSLLRLSSAQIHVRSEEYNIELPSIISVNFEREVASEDYVGKDTFQLRIPNSLAQLFGPGQWAAVSAMASGYDDLKGWLVSFYATHTVSQWLPVKTLYYLSGYTSHYLNFKNSLNNVLTILNSSNTPPDHHIDYSFSPDGNDLRVVTNIMKLKKKNMKVKK